MPADLSQSADYVRYAAGEVVGFHKVAEGPQKYRGKTVIEVCVDDRYDFQIGDAVRLALSPNGSKGARS